MSGTTLSCSRMPSDRRKTITVPEPTYNRLVDLHGEIRPHDRAPYWWTIEQLLDQFEPEE